MTEKEMLIYIDKLKARVYYLEANANCYREIIKNKDNDIKFLKQQLSFANEKLRIYKEVNYKQYCLDDY